MRTLIVWLLCILPLSAADMRDLNELSRNWLKDKPMSLGEIKSVTVLGPDDYDGEFNGIAIEIGIEGMDLNGWCRDGVIRCRKPYPYHGSFLEKKATIDSDSFVGVKIVVLLDYHIRSGESVNLYIEEEIYSDGHASSKSAVAQVINNSSLLHVGKI